MDEKVHTRPNEKSEEKKEDILTKTVMYMYFSFHNTFISLYKHRKREEELGNDINQK